MGGEEHRSRREIFPRPGCCAPGGALPGRRALPRRWFLGVLEVDPLERFEALGQLGDLFPLLARALVEASDLRIQREDQAGRLAPAAVRVLFEEASQGGAAGFAVVRGAVGQEPDHAEPEQGAVDPPAVGPVRQDLAVELRRPGMVAGSVQGVGAFERPTGAAPRSAAGEAPASGEAGREDGEDREGEEGRAPGDPDPAAAGADPSPGAWLVDGRVDGSPPARAFVRGRLGGTRRTGGKLQQEAAASPLPVLDADAPIVSLDDGAGDGQS